MNPSKPQISVIIPAYNAGKTLSECLRCLFRSEGVTFEIIVVDDCSNDGSVEAVAHQFSCKVISMSQNSGAAAARNTGAREAASDLLMFLDSDVYLARDALQLIVEALSRDDVAATVGSYSLTYPVTGFFSSYQSLFTYYHHDMPEGDISWFWTAMGGIRKDVFEELGGFNETYTGASAEDIEAGYTLAERGHRVVLNKGIKGAHAHHHTFKSILRNDFKKSAAWAQLFLQKNRQLKFKHRFTGIRNTLNLAVVAIFLLGAVGSFLSSGYAWFTVATLLLWFVMNFRFFKFLSRERNWVFALVGFAFHFLTFIVIFCGAAVGTVKYIWHDLLGMTKWR